MELFGIFFFSETHCHCHHSNTATSEGVKRFDAWVRVRIKSEALVWSNFFNKLICSHGADGACLTVMRSSSESRSSASGSSLCEDGLGVAVSCGWVGVWPLHHYKRKTDTVFTSNNNYAHCSALKHTLCDNRAKPVNYLPCGIAGCLAIAVAMRYTICWWEYGQALHILLWFYSPPASLWAR